LPKHAFKSIPQLSLITYPLYDASNPTYRKSRLLAWVLIALCFLSAAILLFVIINQNQTQENQKVYTIIITIVLVLLLTAYFLNLTGRYVQAAGLTISSAIMGAWLSILMDKNIIAGDFVPLIYTIIPVFLASLFLSTRLTIIISLLQLIILFIFPFYLAESAPINWASLLSFFMIASSISIMMNIIHQKDLSQIEQQTQEIIANNEKLQQAAIRDPLTNLFNRRYMAVTLDREIHRAMRAEIPLGILMMDLDHFKEINDLYGHSAGDLILQALGTCLQECTRKSDIACRFGGEEFVIIMPGASQDVVLERAELLREKAKNFILEHEGNMIKSISISIGVSIYPQHGINQDRLLINADKALYQAKRSGRNRVNIYDPKDVNTLPDRL
jgi:diguanylate cyclase (GGDEF)-like protein